MSPPRCDENLQRVGFLSLVPGLLKQFGVEPIEVLAVAGLSAGALENPDATIPYVSAGRLLLTAAEKTECAEFGLQLGKGVNIASLGLVGRLARNAPTLGGAILDFACNQHRNAHGGVSYVLQEGPRVFLGYAVYQPDVPGNDLISDLAAMAAFKIVCELLGSGQQYGIEVLLSRSEPRDPAAYRRAFGVKVHFDAEQTALLLPRALLECALPYADANLRRSLQKRVGDLWCAGTLDTVTQLRRVLRVALISGEASADEVSEQMGMSRRTLRRRLNACGLRFHQILGETRYGFAQQLLAHTGLSISQIAAIVGYADPSTLTRAFRRWSGIPPSALRSRPLS